MFFLRKTGTNTYRRPDGLNTRYTRNQFMARQYPTLEEARDDCESGETVELAGPQKHGSGRG